MSCSWRYNVDLSSTSYYRTKTVEVQVSIAKDADGYAIMSVHFPDAAMAIPEGGHACLTLSTYNETNTLANKQFINTCFVTPLDAQGWDNTTNKGNVTTLETPFAQGALSSVRNSAPVTTSYGYATSSSKSVAEVGNETNAATCTSDPNYIVLTDETRQFRYTLTVGNTTPKAMAKLVLIDNLPEVGDHTTFLADDPRFSEFKASLVDDPAFSVVVTAKDGTTTTLDSSSYTIEYSTATEFTSQDWNGASTDTWSSDAQGARSIRLVINDATASLIPADSSISLSFTCQIEGNAAPGQVAWNSFGYHYRLNGETSELEAAPLKVGVKVPAVPELRKQVVDHSGQARAVDADASFDFLVYTGTALTGTYSTYDEWAAALEADGRTYDTFTVTVKAGESLSSSVAMATTKWTWKAGQKYTIVELPCSEDYAFKRFQGSVTQSYTLTYNAAQVQVVTCENYAQRWSIELLKQSTAGNPLAGAVFGLYSPNAADALAAVPEEYASLNIALTLDHGGTTWYLASVERTPAGGELTWADLLRDQYYLLEVKAPDGYNLNNPAGQVLKRDKETQGTYSLTVVNRSGYSLPETGGPGAYLYALSGLALLLGAASLLAILLARRRGEAKRTA